MAIQTQLNYNASNVINQIVMDELYMNNNNQQHALFNQQSFLDALMEKQRQEIDQFIRTQSERLRYALREQRRQETETLLRQMEAKALVLMTRKEEEMSRALSKNMELEDLLRRMEAENQTWQRMARENEATVATLSSTLEQVKERAVTWHNNEGSCCGGGDDSVPGKRMSGSCLNCGSNGETRVLFLPCRHLCCCTECEAGLIVCPICSSPKKNRIEAITF
ncbi:BnaAnng11660D [Brassica napus]|uniref:(rape) hypothetical protein n=1 Tax=Brassica napus TaxID=3708 RepID=A0A078IS18_BRANA|nr:unnamed protein product [Brassica napus]CDY52651.1 BnaAnng11660D [Brassica napus]